MLDVRPDDGSPRYRATCTNSSFDNVQGDEVLVKCKPAKQKVKFAGRTPDPDPSCRSPSCEASRGTVSQVTVCAKIWPRPGTRQEMRSRGLDDGRDELAAPTAVLGLVADATFSRDLGKAL